MTVVVHSTPVALNASCMYSIAADAPDASEHVKMSQMAVCVSGHECTEMWLSASSATAVTPCAAHRSHAFCVRCTGIEGF